MSIPIELFQMAAGFAQPALDAWPLDSRGTLELAGVDLALGLLSYAVSEASTSLIPIVVGFLFIYFGFGLESEPNLPLISAGVAILLGAGRRATLEFRAGRT